MGSLLYLWPSGGGRKQNRGTGPHPGQKRVSAGIKTRTGKEGHKQVQAGVRTGPGRNRSSARQEQEPGQRERGQVLAGTGIAPAGTRTGPGRNGSGARQEQGPGQRERGQVLAGTGIAPAGTRTGPGKMKAAPGRNKGGRRVEYLRKSYNAAPVTGCGGFARQKSGTAYRNRGRR